MPGTMRMSVKTITDIKNKIGRESVRRKDRGHSLGKSLLEKKPAPKEPFVS